MAQSVAAIVSFLERFAPPEWAFQGDRVGLHLGSPGRVVQRVLTALDLDDAVLRKAQDGPAAMIVVHHPPIWEPLKTLTDVQPMVRRLLQLDAAGHAVYAMHTNWDAAPGGVSDTLAEQLGLSRVEPIGQGTPLGQYLLTTYVPPAHAQEVLDAMANAGAGVIGDYERCAFLTEGRGTFLPGPGANPTIGEPGTIEEVEETRIEMLVPAHRVGAVTAALKLAHPYEEPAFHLVSLRSGFAPSSLRVGDWNRGDLGAFGRHVEQSLRTQVWIYGEHSGPVERVALAGGAGLFGIEAAIAVGAQVFLTGEAKHSEALAARDAGLTVVLAGHGPTEAPGMKALAERLQTEEIGVPVEFVPPAP